MASEAIPVIYIDSVGHSGSTLLNLLIGGHPQVFSVGDFQLDNPKTMQRPCLCGATPFYTCPVWSSVDQILKDSAGLSLQNVGLNVSDRDEFRQHNLSIFKTIQDVTSRKYILESSKDIARCLRLAKEPDLFRVYPIFLKRYLPGVAASYKKKKRNLWDIYFHYNVRCFYHYKYRQFAACLVEYEDLCQAPVEIMRQIMRSTGLDFFDSQLKWDPLTRHNIGGNHMRLNRNNDIVPDNTWESLLTPGEKVCASIFGLPGTWIFRLARYLKK